MKRVVISGLIVLGIVALSLGGLFLLQQKTSPQTQETVSTTLAKKIPSSSQKEYIDPSGFRFSHSEDVTVEEKKSTDSSVYSEVLLTSPRVAGTISLLVADSKVSSIDEWVKEKTLLPEKVDRVKLGSLDASQVPKLDGVITGALDQGVLFSLDVSWKDDKAFWENVYHTLLSSFSFSQPQSSGSSSTSSSQSSNDVIFEGEEVVE